MTLRSFYAAVRALAGEAGIHGTVIVDVSLQGDSCEVPGLRVSASIHRGNVVVASVSQSVETALAELRRQIVAADLLHADVAGLADEEIAS